MVAKPVCIAIYTCTGAYQTSFHGRKHCKSIRSSSVELKGVRYSPLVCPLVKPSPYTTYYFAIDCIQALSQHSGPAEPDGLATMYGQNGKWTSGYSGDSNPKKRPHTNTESNNSYANGGSGAKESNKKPKTGPSPSLPTSGPYAASPANTPIMRTAGVRSFLSKCFLVWYSLHDLAIKGY